jgi:hypothetical protein
MTRKALRAFVILPCAAALILGVSAAQAESMRSDTFTIPFAFQVQNHTLPPGLYRVEQEPGTDIAQLVNLQTREHVQIMRAAVHQPGKVRITFTDTAGRHTLTKIE